MLYNVNPHKNKMRSGNHREHRNYVPSGVSETWKAFQEMRLKDTKFNYKSPEIAILPIVKQTTTTSEKSVSSKDCMTEPCTKTAGRREAPTSHHSSSRKHSSTSERRWARSWANSRAQQALLTKNNYDTINHGLKEDSHGERNTRDKTRSKSRSIVELDAKSAATFGRLKSIYNNEVERDRRLQSIKKRINNIQKDSVRKEVNKSIQEYTVKLKEDEKNRKELRSLREKFTETKKNRLKHMHVSRHALDLPSVSRMAYGLPQEGKEFSTGFSSRKTTNEIKNMWRMAFVRRNCVETFLRKISEQKTHELPSITIKSAEHNSKSRKKSSVSKTDQEDERQVSLGSSLVQNTETTDNAAKLQRLISESVLELLSSEDEDI